MIWDRLSRERSSVIYCFSSTNNFLLKRLLVNCLVAYAVNNCLVKSVEAHVPTHIVAHQLRQSTRALIGSGGGT